MMVDRPLRAALCVMVSVVLMAAGALRRDARADCGRRATHDVPMVVGGAGAGRGGARLPDPACGVRLA